eukprot:16433645-Heterocapsa_arctica.AAC.1
MPTYRENIGKPAGRKADKVPRGEGRSEGGPLTAGPRGADRQRLCSRGAREAHECGRPVSPVVAADESHRGKRVSHTPGEGRCDKGEKVQIIHGTPTKGYRYALGAIGRYAPQARNAVRS